MLYIAYSKTKREHWGKDLSEKSRNWWNGTARPEGLEAVAFYSALGNSPDVFVFEAPSHEAIAAMVKFWVEVEFEIHPAVDLLNVFRLQGMHVDDK